MDDDIRRRYDDPPDWRTEAPVENPNTIKPSPLKILQRIAADTTESTSIRQDARRLLQIADTSPSRFQAEYRDFQAWRKETACPKQ